MSTHSALRRVSILLVFSLCLQCVAPVLAAPQPLAPPRQGATITPETIRLELAPGSCSLPITVTVRTASAPIPKVDVLFVFDVTGSMREVLEQAKARGLDIMKALRSRVEDSAFGVASFCDYPGYYDYAGYSGRYGADTDYPWALDADITSDIAAVQRSLESLTLHNGQDGPEDYSRALFETMYVSWRPGAKKIVVLFGDAPAHDVEFYKPFGRNFGVDPGLDGEAGTEDDLKFTEVVAQVRERGIQVIPVNCDLSRYEIVKAGFDYIAQQTGGQVYPLEDAALLADAVIAGLTRATSVIHELKLSPPKEFSEWVQVSPSFFSEVGGNESRSFQVVFSVPSGLPPGVYSFPLDVLADSAVLGSVQVTIVTGGIPLEPEKIKGAKLALIRDLSEPQYETEFLKVRSTIRCRAADPCGYGDGEVNVKAWVDGLPREMNPSQLGAIYRLTLQEEALKALLHAQAKAAHVGNIQAGHAIGLAFSAHAAGNFVQGVVGKSVVGRLISKIRDYIQAKLLAMAVDAILWFTQQLPPDPSLEKLRAGLRMGGVILEERLQNALRKEKITGGFLKELLEDVLVLPLDRLAIEIYIGRTEENLRIGLQKAQEIAKTPTTMDEVRAQAPYIKGQVEEITRKAEQDQRVLQEQAEKLEDLQSLLKVAANASEALGLIGTLTGVGALASQLGFLVSLAVQAIDMAMAGYTLGKAYLLWWAIPGKAREVTQLAFGSPLPEASLTSDRGHGPGMGYALSLPETSREPASPSPGRPSGHVASVERASELPAHLRAQLRQMSTDVSSYTLRLSQLADAVRSGERSAVERAAEELLAADEALSKSLLSVRQPIFAAAHALIGDERFASAYATFGRSAAAFDGEGASLYLYLLAWLAEPENEETKGKLLSQIETVRAATEAYSTALEDVLPFTTDFASEPSVIVTGYTLPGWLTIGQQAALSVQIFNPAPKTAEGVAVSLDVGSAASAVSSETTKTLDVLGGQQHRTLQFRFVPTKESGLLAISTSAKNGSGSLFLISFTAAASPPSAAPPTVLPLPPTPGGTTPPAVTFFVVFLLLGGGGALTYYVLSTSQRRAPFSLLVTRGSARPMRLPLTKPAVQIGRGLQNDLVVDDPKVSRQHCRIEKFGNQLVLTDLGSLNGTFVNGEKVQRRVLQPGDVIRVGDVELILQHIASQRF